MASIERSRPEDQRASNAGGGAAWWWWIIGIIVAILIIWAIWAGTTRNRGVGQTGSAGAGAGAAGITASEIIANPQAYVGKPVVVSSTVANVIDTHAFTISANEGAAAPAGAAGTLLVVSSQALPAAPSATGAVTGTENVVTAGQAVQVAGTVRMFNLSDIERETGTTLNAAQLQAYNGQPVIVANQVEWGAPGQGGATGAAPAPGTQTAAPQPGMGTPVAVPTIMGSPSQYEGQMVTVDGTVGKVIDPNAFTVQDPKTKMAMLVVGTAGTIPSLKQGDKVQVKGRVAKFDRTAFDSDMGVSLPEGQVGQYAGRPAIEASNVKKTG